jgi:hypothetical protein
MCAAIALRRRCDPKAEPGEPTLESESHRFLYLRLLVIYDNICVFELAFTLLSRKSAVSPAIKRCKRQHGDSKIRDQGLMIHLLHSQD